MRSDDTESAVHRLTRTYCRLAHRQGQREEAFGAPHLDFEPVGRRRSSPRNQALRPRSSPRPHFNARFQLGHHASMRKRKGSDRKDLGIAGAFLLGAVVAGLIWGRSLLDVVPFLVGATLGFWLIASARRRSSDHRQ